MDYTLDHVGVSVENLDAQVEWYSRALGLERKGRFQVEALGLSGEFLLSPEGWAIEMLPSSPMAEPNTDRKSVV